jgi:CHASE1-domain containing sensor protein
MWTLANLAVAFCYLLSGGLILKLGQVFAIEIPLRPEAGLAFVCVLRWGAPLLPGVMAGALVINLLDLASAGLSPGQLALLSSISASGSSLQALAAAWLVHRWLGPSPSLSKSRSITLFLGMAGPISCLIAAAVGATTLVLGGVLSSQDGIQRALVWWVGDSIGVIVFAPLLLMALPSQAAIWRGRRWLVALPSVLLTGLFVGLVLLDGNLQHRQLVGSLERATERAANVLQMKLTWQEGALHAVRGLFRASEQVTRSEFRTFTLSILERTEGLAALSWNPLVTRAERPAFERRLQETYADSGLRISERRDGLILPAGAHASHVVVMQIEPFETHRAALGYDIQSDPTRALALRHAVEKDMVQATAPIRLVQSDRIQVGILKVLPVFDDHGSLVRRADRYRDLRGFVVGVLQLDDFFATTFAAPIWQELNLHLNDVTTPDEPMAIASNLGRQRTIEPSALARRPRDMVRRRRFEQAGRIWELEVRPNPAFFFAQPVSKSPALLVGGLSLVAVLEALLLLISGAELESRRDLEQQLRLSLMTAGLAHEIKQPLSALLLQSRRVSQLVSDQGHLGQKTELEKTIRGMGESCRTMSQSITAIQHLLSHRSTVLLSLDLGDLVRNAMLIVKSDARDRGIHLQSSGLDLPRVIIGDAEQLQLMVLNLLRNSLEVTPAGGVVEAALVLTQRWLELRVADSGPGFIRKPSDPDQSLLTSTKPGGFGLGLYMVRIAADHHGATIHFGQSSLGGAEVVVSFPARLIQAATSSRVG